MNELRTSKTRTYHVNVRLKNDRPNGDWHMEWRQVRAVSFDESFKLAEQMSDVRYVYESSLIAGGVIT
jgi:hypothetical protein